MLNPCRKCIVKANCTKECNEHKIFINRASKVTAIFSVIVVCIVLGTILFKLELGILPIWIGFVVLCHIIPTPAIECSSLEIFLMAPFIIVTLLVAVLTKKYVVIPSEYARNKSKPLIQRILDYRWRV